MAADTVFLDTAGWVALLNSRDGLHSAATHLWARLVSEKRGVILTDLVIAETGNALAPTPARAAFAPSLDLLKKSPRVEIVEASGRLLNEAVGLYDARADKNWGLVDCASFLVMRRRGVLEAVTSDRHFVQAGFTALLGM